MTDDSLIIGDYDVINRLKAYSFSLDEIKQIFQSEEMLFKRIAVDKLTMSGNPMVLFHSAEYTPAGLIQSLPSRYRNMSQVADEKENITEVYYPVKKIISKNQ